MFIRNDKAFYLKAKTAVKWVILGVMYLSVCKFCGGGRGWGKNGFIIWPRSEDLGMVKGKA
jgi:hypothetical protein